METENLGCIWLFRSLSACRHWRLNAWKLEDSPEDRSEDRLEDSPEDRLEDRTEEKMRKSCGGPEEDSRMFPWLSIPQVPFQERTSHVPFAKFNNIVADNASFRSPPPPPPFHFHCPSVAFLWSKSRAMFGRTPTSKVAKKHQNANKPPRFVSDLALLDASKLDDGTADE
ncbi:hypothetical protein niasHT_022706 [Heterodera trifolii]|uniref:Uncharacterized protein n=1 Tax=Heterodera trifolii TaxID=157864 RepID=A0ABD2KN73_9BILA